MAPDHEGGPHDLPLITVKRGGAVEADRGLLDKAGLGVRLSGHIEGADGASVFAHGCRIGLEGVVGKRRDRLPIGAVRRLG
jgi:hypothetical protein